MADDEDPAGWREKYVNPFVYPAYEGAAQAAHAAHIQHLRRHQQQQQEQRDQQVQREQWIGQQREQHRQQQLQHSFQQGRPQLQAGQAFEGNTPRSYVGTQIVASYNSDQPVTTGKPGGHSVRPSNREVLNPQHVRPSDIGPSFPYYLPNTSRRANVPFHASFRPPAGAMQASRPMMTQQTTSQNVSESRFPRPSDYTAQKSSSTSNRARQERSSATLMPNRLPLIRQQHGGHQNQAPAPAFAVSGQAAQMPSDNTIQGTQMDASVSSFLTPDPLHRPASRSPKESGVSESHSQTTSMPFSQRPHQPSVVPGQNNPENSHSAPTQGQKPPNKIRRLDDGSKHGSGTDSKGYMSRAKQASQSKIQRLDLVRPLDVNDIALKDSYDVATIARDVLITAGKHPSEKALNYHLHALMKTIPVLDYSSDLATLKWDGIDPLIYARDKRPRNTSTRPPAQPINTIGAVAPQSSHANSLPPQPSSLPSLPHNSYHSKSKPSIPPPPPIPFTPVPAPERAPSKPQAVAETPTTKLSSTPLSKIPSPSPRAVPPARSQQTKEYFQMQVVISSSPKKMPPTKKRVGRPKKDTKSDNVAVTVPSPSEPPIQFPVFKCLWEKCQTELHSLVLLQQHVLKAHLPHNITCGWKECDNSTSMPASTLWEHLRDMHFKDYAWALGDGPTVPSLGEGDQDESPFVPQFDLFDRQARPATVLLPLDDYVVAGYSKSHGIKNSKQRAELFKEAGCRWKEEAGPDVDISDRRLSTPPRLVTSRLTEIAMTPSESP